MTSLDAEAILAVRFWLFIVEGSWAVSSIFFLFPFFFFFLLRNYKILLLFTCYWILIFSRKIQFYHCMSMLLSAVCLGLISMSDTQIFSCDSILVPAFGFQIAYTFLHKYYPRSDCCSKHLLVLAIHSFSSGNDNFLASTLPCSTFDSSQIT